MALEADRPTRGRRRSDLMERPLEHARELAAFAGLMSDVDVTWETAAFVRSRPQPPQLTEAR
jgi:hypothetical protein